MDDNRQARMPVLSMLQNLKGRTWLHMPGHGGSLPWLDAALDQTEILAADDLHEPVPGGAFEEAQALMAEAAGVTGCIFLAGGSTLGVQAMLMGFASPGSKVILPRNVHKSAISACALGGLEPVYVQLRWERDRAVLCPEDVLFVMRENPSAKVVFLTRPDYYGTCGDVDAIADECKRLKMAFLIDEAHGAHLMYGHEIPHAGRLGADAWTISTHKTLPALTQSACLFFREQRNEAALRRVLHMLGSSSPSFLLAASIDWARARMVQCGVEWIAATIAENRAVRKILHEAGYGDSFQIWKKKGIQYDETRVVIDTALRGISGFDAHAELSAQGIDIEMADERRIVCIPPLGGSENSLKCLVGTLLSLPEGKPVPSKIFPVLKIPERACGIREAAFGRGEAIPIELAAGRICAEAFGTYPPGIPLAMPGERIGREVIEIFKEAKRLGGGFFGTRDGKVNVLCEK